MLKCFLIRLGTGHTLLRDSISHSVICQFIYWHWLDIVLAIVFMLFFSVLISYLASRPNGIVAKLIYGLVIEAEKDLGSKTGQLKKKQVISKVYQQLPVFIRFVVNEATVSTYKDMFLKLVPIMIITLVFCFSGWSNLSSFGMIMFWGLILIAVYNVIVTKTLLKLRENK